MEMIEGESEAWRKLCPLQLFFVEGSQEGETLGVSINITDLLFVQNSVASLGYRIAALVCVLFFFFFLMAVMRKQGCAAASWSVPAFR